MHLLICGTVKKVTETPLLGCSHPGNGATCYALVFSACLSPSSLFLIAHTSTQKHAYMFLLGNSWPQANKTQPNSGGRALRDTNTTRHAHSSLAAQSSSVIMLKRLFPHPQGCKVGNWQKYCGQRTCLCKIVSKHAESKSSKKFSSRETLKFSAFQIAFYYFAFKIGKFLDCECN